MGPQKNSPAPVASTVSQNSARELVRSLEETIYEALRKILNCFTLTNINCLASLEEVPSFNVLSLSCLEAIEM